VISIPSSHTSHPSPHARGWGLPVILHEPDVVFQRIDPHRAEGVEVQFHIIRGARLMMTWNW